MLVCREGEEAGAVWRFVYEAAQHPVNRGLLALADNGHLVARRLGLTAGAAEAQDDDPRAWLAWRGIRVTPGQPQNFSLIFLC